MMLKQLSSNMAKHRQTIFRVMQTKSHNSSLFSFQG
jgi:hypothetical protein